MKVIKYDKLIRDKIPQIIESKGHKVIVETLNDDDYLINLNKKLQEELDEYIADNNVEELADLVEVVYAILKYKKVNLEEFETIRKEKVDNRGAFDKRLFLKEVEEQ